jgi:hypothetical protein
MYTTGIIQTSQAFHIYTDKGNNLQCTIIHGASPCFYLPLLTLLCSPFNPFLLTWNPPSCDRIRPPRSQVACELTSPVPPFSPTPPPSKFPEPQLPSTSLRRPQDQCGVFCPEHVQYRPAEHEHVQCRPAEHEHVQCRPAEHGRVQCGPAEHEHLQFRPAEHEHVECRPAEHGCAQCRPAKTWTCTV